MAVSEHHWALLTKAATSIEPGAFARYFELKRLLASGDRKAFQHEFTTYYRLNIGGLTPKFKRRYFELLFECSPSGHPDPYTPILIELHAFERLKGGPSIQASFVSKLVAIHDESRPIYDRHVSNFFGMGVPTIGTPEFRIAGFVANLVRIQEQYEEWAGDPRFGAIQATVFKKQPRLKDCHPSRLCDLLVWTVGSKGLG